MQLLINHSTTPTTTKTITNWISGIVYLLSCVACSTSKMVIQVQLLKIPASFNYFNLPYSMPLFISSIPYFPC
jgi:hypothetical protein